MAWAHKFSRWKAEVGDRTDTRLLSTDEGLIFINRYKPWGSSKSQCDRETERRDRDRRKGKEEQSGGQPYLQDILIFWHNTESASHNNTIVWSCQSHRDKQQEFTERPATKQGKSHHRGHQGSNQNFHLCIAHLCCLDLVVQHIDDYYKSSKNTYLDKISMSRPAEYVSPLEGVWIQRSVLNVGFSMRTAFSLTAYLKNLPGRVGTRSCLRQPFRYSHRHLLEEVCILIIDVCQVRVHVDVVCKRLVSYLAMN